MKRKLCCIMSALLALSICVPGGAMQALAAEGGPLATGEPAASPAIQEPGAAGQAGDESETSSAFEQTAEQGDAGPDEDGLAAIAPADEEAVSDEESDANGTRAGPGGAQENPVVAAMKAILRAPAAAKQVTATVTDLEIQKPQGTPITEIDVGAGFYLAMDWKVDDPNDILHAGDYFDITLPDEMNFAPEWTQPDFDIKDANGAVVAHGHVTPGDGGVGGTVHVTFNDAVENNYNVHGTIYLYSVFNRDKINNNQTNTFTVSVQGKPASTEVTVNKVGLSDDEVLAKWGQKGTSDGEVSWWVRINYKKADLQNTVITDSLTEGTGNEKYVPGSFSLRRVELSDTGTVLQTYETINVSDRVTFGPDNRSFTLDLGDLGANQYYLVYRTTYDAASGATLKNRLKLESSDGSKEVSTTYHLQGSGGTAGGDLASKIKIVKVDAEDSTTPLAGATFEVTRPDGSTFELTTGVDGTITSDVLPQGTYTARETVAPTGYELSGQEYTFEVTPTGGAVKTITDEPTKISIGVTKAWVGPEGGPVTVHLMADGVDTGKTLTLSADNGWTGNFDGLRQYQAGSATEIVYTVSEDPVENYSPEVAGSVTDGFTVTNTNTEKVSVPVTKTWVGPEGASATVRLLADGNDTGKTLTLTANDGWEGAFGGLDRYDPADGHEIAYSIAEDAVENYSSEVSGDAASGFTVTNTNTEKVSVPVTKTWVGPKGSAVTVKLLADGEDTGKTVTLDEGNAWSGSFDGLDKYRADDSEIAYTVSEDPVVNYTASIAGDAASGFTVTNTNTETTSVSGTKTWDDDGDRDGVRPDSITVNLLADGTEVDEKEVTAAADGSWSYSFDGLPKYDAADGHEIAYTVTEGAVANYATAIAGTAITNTYTPGKTSVTVSKAWDDANDQDGVRPGSVQVQLYANGQASGSPVTLDENNGWTHTWTGLFQKENGQDVVYTVQEVGVPDGYEAVVTGDATAGFTVTNTHTPAVTEVPVTKTWVGGTGGPVTIHLSANGVDTGLVMQLDESNGWRGVFTDLPRYAGGEEVAYTVTEDAVEGYDSAITGDASSGFTVTNTARDKGRTVFGLPRTGDGGVLPIAALILLLAVSGGIVFAAVRRRRQE